MNFFCKYGGVTTHQPWQRPHSKVVREWRDSLSCPLDDWYVCGNLIEGYSKTWDVDIILYQNPLKISYNDLSDIFSEMIHLGFKYELLIDCAYVSEWYSKDWKPFYKIRPDKEFYKELHGGVYHKVYKSHKQVQLGKNLYKFYYNEPNDNYHKGIHRGYSFKGIPLKNF